MAMNYAPEKTGGRLRTELCEYLSSVGHKVSVATAFPHYPEWQIHEGYRGKLFLREQINGVSIHRSYVYVPGKPSALQRVFYDTSFALSSFLSSLFIKDVDAILCISPPLQLGITGYVLGKLKGARIFLQLVDLIPDAAIILGMMRNKWAIKVARLIENFAYSKAEAIIVICQGFADNLLTKGVPGERIHVFGDWIDTNFIRPLNRNNAFRQQHGLSPQDFVVLYSGNFGVKQGLETLVEVAVLLQDHQDIVFLIAGQGMTKASLMDQVAQRHLKNVRLLPLQPWGVLPDMLSAADVLALVQKAGVVDIAIPSKLLTYMASGRPVVAGVHAQSEAGRYVEDAEGGLVVPPEDPASFAEAIRVLHRDRTLAARLGANARAFAEEHFARERVLQRYDDFFRRIEAEISSSQSGV